ncbi:TM2 domain-containing protein [Schaalia vaccimaxillae]|uniref:TM2 domain-containing protein n=1 Tax=Schaalia vaccimaxillae TaxID=183916 RepID=UPI0003B5662E|nr:TM2 domain-containing protein [Schaalia vaccimaxillae]
MTNPTPQDPNSPYGAPQGQPQYSQPSYGQQPVGTPTGAAKSFVVAILLSIFLGGIGAVDFYMGHKKTGIYKLVLTGVATLLYMIGFSMSLTAVANYSEPSGMGVTLISVGGLLYLAMSAWALVTIICVIARKWMYATDSNGVPLA